MKQDTSSRRRMILMSGIGRVLVLSFLVFSLVPMAVDSYYSYRSAHSNLYDASKTALETSAILKTSEIQAYFEGMLLDIKHQAETQSVTRFLEVLENARRASGQSVEAFVKSYRWALIVDEYGLDLKTFRRAFSYYDVFLINNRGDILFTVAGEDDLGANLFLPPP